MKNSIKKDLKRRNLFKKFEIQRLLYKSLINDSSLPEAERFAFIQKFNELPRNSSKVRLKNRCILTGRGHSVFQFCGLSRIKFRELAHGGHLMGWSKASW